MLSACLVIRISCGIGHSIYRFASHLAGAEFLALARCATFRFYGKAKFNQTAHGFGAREVRFALLRNPTI